MPGYGQALKCLTAGKSLILLSDVEPAQPIGGPGPEAEGDQVSGSADGHADGTCHEMAIS